MRVGKIGPAFANSPQPTVVIPSTPTVVVRRPPPLRADPALRPITLRPAAMHRPPPRRRRGLLIAAVAAVCVAATAGALLWRPGWLADHATAVGERRTIALADGSTAELAGASSIAVDFTGRVRRIVLREGEAFFKVAGDADRPFVVEADGTRVRALGTSFDVKLGDGSVTIAVSEQSVEVTSEGRPPVVVGSGQLVRAGRGLPGDVREADLAMVEAWRQDRLAFHETPLVDVVADLQRYRMGRIVLTEARLGEIPVSAVFEAGQADAAIDTLAATLPIRIRRFTPLLVVVSPRS
jgi:transmembrane sensor